MPFLPVTLEELNYNAPDFILISTDAYVDHPSFGHAIISRLIEHNGFTIGIIPQPQNDEDYKKLGKPKLGFFISGGVVDSMVNNYTVAKKRRKKDVYSEGGIAGKVPDRALTVHTKNVRRLFPDTFICIGGIEASLRRFAHYDYWEDTVMPSLLVDAPADLLIYGMGEKPINEILAMVKRNIPIKKIKDIKGTCYLSYDYELPKKIIKGLEEHKINPIPSYENVKNDKISYIKAFNLQYKNNEFTCKGPLLQKQKEKYLVANPPQLPLTTKELDEVYTYPYMRTYHPMYKKGVPAINEVKFSLSSTRGCFGTCNYCAISMHQGRLITKRSKESLVNEAKLMTEDKDFKGYIHDVGGATANFRNSSCKKQAKLGSCQDKTCIGFSPCQNLEVDHSEYLDILRAIKSLPNIKKVFIRSGIRFDYLMMDKNAKSILKELVENHISGQLRVAPEHCVDKVLKIMNKTPNKVFDEFRKLYQNVTEELGYKQYIVPYLISSHPGSDTKDAIKLACYLKSINTRPEQVQDFYPTPGTKSTTMYYTGLNPDTKKPIYVPKDKHEKQINRALLQYYDVKNYNIIKQALIDNKRNDLIGFVEKCLIQPTKPKPKIKK